MATYRIKLFSKKKDNKKYTSDDVPFIDRFRIKAGRIGDKAFFLCQRIIERIMQRL